MLYLSFLLLHYEMTFLQFFMQYKNKIFFAFVIFFLPKLSYFDINQELLFDSVLLNSAFIVTIITDIIEESVFTIVPLAVILIKIILLTHSKQYGSLFFSIILFLTIFFIYFLIHFLSTRLLNKEVIGFGDILFYFVLSFYYSAIELLFSFWIASVIGIIFIIMNKCLKWQEKIKNKIPFIPCIYLSIEIIKYQAVINYLYTFLF